MDAPWLYHHSPYVNVGLELFWHCSSCSVSSQPELISGVISQTQRWCEPPNVFLGRVLLLFAHQSVNSPTLPTNHSHRETRREQWSTHCSRLRRTTVFVYGLYDCANVFETLACIPASPDGNWQKKLRLAFFFPVDYHHNRTLVVFLLVNISVHTFIRFILRW